MSSPDLRSRPAIGAALVRSLWLVGVLSGACAEPAAPAWFAEVAGESGLDFEHVRARETRHWFPEIMGGGVALFDTDDDGALDVYLVQSGDLSGESAAGTNRLYRNLGDGTFEDRTEGSGAGHQGYGMGAACGDVDQDGDLDLFVSNVGPNALLENRGVFVFADVTAEAGVGDPGWATSSAFLDHDRDGDLDLFVVNYLGWSPESEVECPAPHGGPDYCSPNTYGAPGRDLLYRNAGDGTFEDVSVAAGLGESFGNGLGVSVADFDGDHWIDVYVANDMMPNQLWKNRADGTFEDVALFAGCAANMDGASEAGMGTVAVDVEHDGDLDLFLTHLRDETNTFYENRGGIFADRTARLGLAAPSIAHTGFGVGFADLDHDGHLDLYVANGAVTRNFPPLDPEDPYAEPDQLFRGLSSERGLRFEEVTPQGGVPEPTFETSRGAALGDLDGDGDVDVVVVDSQSRVRLLRNVVSKRGSWILLSPRESSGAPALGALLELRLEGRVLRRYAHPAASYCSSNDPRVHFGLGDRSAPVEVGVIWADGTTERFGPLALETTHELPRGQGRPGAPGD